MMVANSKPTSNPKLTDQAEKARESIEAIDTVTAEINQVVLDSVATGASFDNTERLVRKLVRRIGIRGNCGFRGVARRRRPRRIAGDGGRQEFMACSNNMKQLGLALHGYHDTFRMLPVNMGPHFASPGRNAPALNGTGWIAKVLPQVEQQALYDRMRP